MYECIKHVPPQPAKTEIIPGILNDRMYVRGVSGKGKPFIEHYMTNYAWTEEELREAAAGFLVLAEVLKENNND